MITIKCPFSASTDDLVMIKSLQQIQSPIVRSAYKQAKIKKQKDIRALLTDRFENTDAWLLQSAIISGMAMASADTELKVKTRIFGGKNNLRRRNKDLITNEQWKELRILPLYLVGEANQKGNRKFNFNDDIITFKPNKDTRIPLELPNLRKNYQKLLSAAFILANEKKLPITITMTTENICFSFDEYIVKQYLKGKSVDKPTKIKPKQEKDHSSIKHRYAGIDMNPNYIGISIFDADNLIETKMFSFKDLTGKNTSANKLLHETREVGHSIGQWLEYNRVDYVFIEQLNFAPGSQNKGKNLNRLCINQWKRNELKKILVKYFKLYEINAAYTSTIGNIMERELPDPIAASTAIAKRGYRVVLLKNKQFYPALPSRSYVEDLWKETVIPEYKDWIELHDWVVKKSGLKYRVPIPDIGMFRIYASSSSNIGVI